MKNETFLVIFKHCVMTDMTTFCGFYLSKILASLRTFPKLMYASKKLGSKATAFSK